MNNENRQEQLWESLKTVMPQAGKIDKDQREKLYGLVRRSLLWEQEDEKESTQIYTDGHSGEIRQLIDNLNVSTEDEIRKAVDELQLSAEEEELEYAHWAFRRQSANGEYLDQNVLVPFKLVRLSEYQYLLLCRQENQGLKALFTSAFGQDPAVFSKKALHVEGTSWAGWMWITDPDSEKSRELKEEITLLWKANES